MPEIPAGSVIITPDELWGRIERMDKRTIAIENSLSELKAVVHPALADVRSDIQALERREQKHHDDHEKAIHALQESSWSSKWVPSLIIAILTVTIGGLALYALSNGLIN